MAATSYKSVKLDPSQYVDVVALASSQNSENISGLDLTFQAMHAKLTVFFGGAPAPTGMAKGHDLERGQTIYGSAVDHVWVKGSGEISFWVS